MKTQEKIRRRLYSRTSIRRGVPIPPARILRYAQDASECKLWAMKSRKHRVQSGETVIQLYPGETLDGASAIATGSVAAFYVSSVYSATTVETRDVRVRLIAPHEMPEEGWKRLGSVSAQGHSFVAYQVDP